MLPYKKWMSALGVARYDVDTDFYGEINDFERVEQALSRHIGIPSTPVVNNGDIVSKGDLIAAAGDGLSLPQHASISGRVTLGKDKIIIDKVR